MKMPFSINHYSNGPSRHALLYAKKLLAHAGGNIHTILDVGAGDGIVSSVIGDSTETIYRGVDVGAPIYAKTSHVVYLQEPSLVLDWLRQSARGVGGDKSSDAVVCFDMLEHCDDMSAFAHCLFSMKSKYVMISLPNEMSIHNRVRFLLGKPIPCHGMRMAESSEGHRHRWLIDYASAKLYFANLAESNEYLLAGEVFSTILPRTRWKRLLIKPFLSVFPFSLRSHGFALLFERSDMSDLK